MASGARALPDLIAKIRLDSSGVEQGINALVGNFSKANVGIGIAAAALGGIVGVALEAENKYLELADSVHAYMRVTGESAAVAGAQVQAFKELGVSEESAQAGMLKFSKAIEGTPNKLAALGIEIVKNAQGNVDLNASLYKVIDAYNGTGDAARKNMILLTAFGKGGAAMIPIMDAGSDALRKLEADVRVTFTEKDIEMAHKYQLEQKQVKASTDAVWESVGQKLLPIQKTLVDNYLEGEYVAKKLGETHQNNSRIVGNHAEAIANLTAKYRAEWEASQQSTEKLAGYADAARLASEAADKLAKSIDDATNAEESATNEQIRLERANLHMAESNGKVQLAIEGVTAANKRYGPSSDEALAATQSLTNVMLDQKQSYLDAAVASQKLAEYEAGPGLSKTDLATLGHAAYLKKLEDEAATLAPGSPLRVYLDQYIARLDAIPTSKQTTINTVYSADSQAGRGARASGGPVLPNSVYTVGEAGPETLVMGPSGGSVIPNSGSGGKGMTDDRIVARLDLLIQVLAKAPSANFSTTAYGRT